MGQIKHPQLAYYELRQLSDELGAVLQAVRERNYGTAEGKLRALCDRYSGCAESYALWLAEYERNEKAQSLLLNFD